MSLHDGARWLLGAAVEVASNATAAAAEHAAAGAAHPEHFSFEDLLRTIVFIGAVFASSKAAELVHMPGLVGELLAGCLLGPPLAHFVPLQESFALSVLGEIGLLLLVVEAGLEVDLGTLKQIGVRGLIIGVVGSFLPLGIGTGIATGFGLPWKSALSVGATLSPTSMGVALVILKGGKVLNTPTGQLIVAAAVIDDIVALVILGELRALADPQPLAMALPIVAAVGFTIGVGLFGVLLMPRILNQLILPLIPAEQTEHFLLGLVFAFTIGLMAALNYGQASYVLGAFLAGLCFCTIHSIFHVWSAQVKRIMRWLLKLFFACTVGFQVPIRTFWTAKVFSMGTAFFCAVSGKMLMGVFSEPLNLRNFLVVGMAMSTWGEFAFIISVAAKAEGLLDDETFAAVVLAVIMSVVISPFLLRMTLARYARLQMAAQKEVADDLEAARTGGALSGRIYYLLDVRVKNAWGVLGDVLALLARSHLEVVDFRSEIAGGFVSYEAFLRDTQLTDTRPDTADAEGLAERLAGLRAALLTALHGRDPAATDASGEAPGESESLEMDALIGGNGGGVRAHSYGGGLSVGEVDLFDRLHGFQLTRWLPGRSAEEWAETGLDEEKAIRSMASQGFKRLSTRLIESKPSISRTGSMAGLGAGSSRGAGSAAAAPPRGSVGGAGPGLGRGRPTVDRELEGAVGEVTLLFPGPAPSLADDADVAGVDARVYQGIESRAGRLHDDEAAEALGGEKWLRGLRRTTTADIGPEASRRGLVQGAPPANTE